MKQWLRWLSQPQIKPLPMANAMFASPNWWTGAMVNGWIWLNGHWIWINGEWLWITGDWWMMLVLPSWYCIRSRNCAISPSPVRLPNWSLDHFPMTLLVYFVGFSFTFYCYRSDTWSHVVHLILLQCNLKWWRSFYFLHCDVTFILVLLFWCNTAQYYF